MTEEEQRRSDFAVIETREIIMEKAIKDFLSWLDYEHDMCEYYSESTVEDMKNSKRIFTQKFGELIEVLGFSTYKECMGHCNEVSKVSN